MKIKKVIALIFIVGIISPLLAFDWGGLILNNTGASGPVQKINFNQMNRVNLWLRTPLDVGKNTYFTTEGFYQFKYTHATKKISNVVDLSLLKFSMTIPLYSIILGVNAGRYPIRDFSKYVVNQSLDGFEMIVTHKKFKLSGYVGFSGLLNKHTIKIAGPQTTNNSKIYALAYPYIASALSVQLPNLFLQQSLIFEHYGFYDVAQNGNNYNRAYFTFGMNGGFGKGIFYVFSNTIGLSKTKNTLKMQVFNLTNFELTSFLPFFNSTLGWHIFFATGDTNKTKGDFKPFTLNSASIDGSIPLAGTIKTGIIGSIKPINSLLISMGIDVLMNVSNRAQKGYLGTQWNVLAKWQIVSDLDLSVSVGQIIKKDPKNSYFIGNIKLLFSF